MLETCFISACNTDVCFYTYRHNPGSFIKSENRRQSDLMMHVFWPVTLVKWVTDTEDFKGMYFLQLQRVTRCKNYKWISVSDCYARARTHTHNTYTAQSICSHGTLNHLALPAINLVHPFKIPDINSPCHSAQQPRTLNPQYQCSRKLARLLQQADPFFATYV